MAALPVVLCVGWFRRRCGVGGDAGTAGHHGCVQKITEDTMRPLAEFTRSPCRAHFVPRRVLGPVERPAALPAAPLVPMALAHLVLPVVGRVLQRSLELAPYVHAQGGAGVCVRGRHAATQYVGSCEMIGGRTNDATGNRPHMSP